MQPLFDRKVKLRPKSSEMTENARHFRFISLRFWPHRLTVRTSGSHPDNRGSIPREVTIRGLESSLQLEQLVYLWWRAVFSGSQIYLGVSWHLVE